MENLKLFAIVIIGILIFLVFYGVIIGFESGLYKSSEAASNYFFQ